MYISCKINYFLSFNLLIGLISTHVSASNSIEALLNSRDTEICMPSSTAHTDLKVDPTKEFNDRDKGINGLKPGIKMNLQNVWIVKLPENKSARKIVVLRSRTSEPSEANSFKFAFLLDSSYDQEARKYIAKFPTKSGFSPKVFAFLDPTSDNIANFTVRIKKPNVNEMTLNNSVSVDFVNLYCQPGDSQFFDKDKPGIISALRN